MTITTTNTNYAKNWLCDPIKDSEIFDCSAGTASKNALKIAGLTGIILTNGTAFTGFLIHRPLKALYKKGQENWREDKKLQAVVDFTLIGMLTIAGIATTTFIGHKLYHSQESEKAT